MLPQVLIVIVIDYLNDFIAIDSNGKKHYLNNGMELPNNIIIKEIHSIKIFIINQKNKHHIKNIDLIIGPVKCVGDISRLFERSDPAYDISKWNMREVTDMNEMFLESKFNGNISNWDTRNVFNMSHMFNGSNFNRDINKWNTSSVISMSYMFLCSDFDGDISNWDIRKVFSKSSILYGCKK